MKIVRLDKQVSPLLPRVIVVDFPERKYFRLLHTLGYKHNEPLGLEDCRKIFVNAIYLFLRGSWSQDQLSAVASDLWEKSDKTDELGEALYECSELIFYIRSIYDPLAPDSKGQFEAFMSTTIQFYEKYSSDVAVEKETEEYVAAELKEAEEKIERYGLGPK